MSAFTPDTLRTVCGGRFLARPERAPATPPTGVSIDSRSLRPGNIFIAIKGDTHDGHDFLVQAARAGAHTLILHDEARFAATLTQLPPAIHTLLVPDTRKALLRLAAAYRRSLDRTRVIAVCGSNGKTTTTRFIHAALSTRLRGTCPRKSFNNDIGVPLTILSAKPADHYLICEVGSNAPGEIAALAAVVEPDVAVITSIGREHLQGFGDLAGVAREEAAILTALRPGGAAILTADSPELRPLTQSLDATPAARTLITFGRAPDASLRLTAWRHTTPPDSTDPDGLTFTLNDRATFTLPLVGEHNALNAAAAVAVARRLGLADDDIAAGLASASGPEMRMQRTTIAGVRFVNDAYNANPDSTLAALAAFAALSAGAPRRVVVLGDMLELGSASDAAHAEIMAAAAALLPELDMLIAFGPRSTAALPAFAAAGGDPTRAVALPAAHEPGAIHPARAAALLRPGDHVLLKGSRGMALERVIAAWQTRLVNEVSPPPLPPLRR